MDNLIYLYALAPSSEIEKESLPSLKSFDGKGELRTLAINDEVTAIVCGLDANEYSEEIIEGKVDNDMEWLQEKAFHHHETVAKLYGYYTLIPLKFCTIYKTEESLKETIQGVNQKVTETLDFLKDKEEWTLKLYSDDNKLRKHVDTANTNIEEKRKEIEHLPKGRRFFEEKKIDKLIDKELENEKDRIAETLHEKLKNLAVDYNVKKSWGKDVTGLQEDMTLNTVYLLSNDKVEQFKAEIQDFEKDLPEEGWRVDANGPWPAYHFSALT